MADKINDCGSAFPLHPGIASDWSASTGLTKRDWFAGQALAGMLANEQLYRQVSQMDLPARAFQLADAMLKAREASNG